MSILRSSATAEDGRSCKARNSMWNEAYFSYAAKTNDALNPDIAGQMGVFQQPA